LPLNNVVAAQIRVSGAVEDAVEFVSCVHGVRWGLMLGKRAEVGFFKSESESLCLSFKSVISLRFKRTLKYVGFKLPLTHFSEVFKSQLMEKRMPSASEAVAYPLMNSVL